MIVCIYAGSIQTGGGKTHLVELLRAVKPEALGVKRIILFCNSEISAMFQDCLWIQIISPLALNRGLLQRFLWERFCLTKEIRRLGCDVLFVPGTVYRCNFKPVVVMSQNLLPFDNREILRFGLAWTTIRLLLLRYVLTTTFKKADGVIFLTDASRQKVLNETGPLNARTYVVAHGVNKCFHRNLRLPYDSINYNKIRPFRLLYVSIIERYKNQVNVVKAIAALRNDGFNITIDLVGPADRIALKELNAAIDLVDPDRRWVHYHGAVHYDHLDKVYSDADAFIWASSCEAFGMILIEAMAAGLPLVCLNTGTTREIVGDQGAVFFDSVHSADIERAVKEVLLSSQLREALSALGQQRALNFTWAACAERTFSILLNCINSNKNVKQINN